MAAFNFPPSPSTNDDHTENGVTWTWNGTVWKAKGSTSGGAAANQVLYKDSNNHLTGENDFVYDGQNLKILDGYVQASDSTVDVQQTIKTDVDTRSSSSYADIPDMSVTITPKNAGNRVLILCNLNCSFNSQGNDGFFRMVRRRSGQSDVYLAAGNDDQMFAQVSGQNSYFETNAQVCMVVDNPNTTSQLTYVPQWKAAANIDVIINARGVGNNDSFECSSQIVAIELGERA